MKPYFFILLFTTLLLPLFGQSGQLPKAPLKNSIKFGFGTAYLNQGNYFGKQRHLQFDRRLFRLMSLGLNVGYISAAQQKSDGFEQSNKAFQGEATLFLTPINNQVNSFKLGGGAVYRLNNYRYTSQIVRVKDEIIRKEFSEEQYSTPGYSVMLEYEVYIAQLIVLGSRASFQKFENKDKTFFWGLHAGLRF